ncbi:peptide pheromone precursor HPP1 [Trichoderma reesei RUT C-30]|uniref:Peptide pheromone HPP1 n=1 Tax=Hypocrea jecorina (strain ATCC 56765 / BCRC 32924 / NRRL 11460 / Rut C-30) TaxID=1344414 RepID=A0A024RXW8_HYPJR|nr:peptide pheromone precursor HPP1 [Trichoderma reesei RUT C-30]
MAQTGNLGCTVMAKPQSVERKRLIGCSVMTKPAANDKKFTGLLGCTVIRDGHDRTGTLR